jgi:cytochrome c peroxidase
MYRALVVIVSLLLMGVSLLAKELVPIPLYPESINKDKIILGQALFIDPILSKDNTMSCMTCHDLKTNGATTTAYTIGASGEKGKFNVPTVFNAVYNFRQFWDGRAKDLKEQALDPIENPIEMGNTIKNLIKDLKASSKYKKLFTKAYPNEGITDNSIADALSSFESILTTPNSKFDKYLKGETDILNKAELEGYRLFKEKGCISCHSGINIGGNLYNKFGIYEESNSRQLGRYMITGKESDKFVFKVPSLRNIAKTAPYMHDGRAKSLKEAVEIMSLHQLGRPMEEKELLDIVSFLHTLTGQIPSFIKDLDVK